MNDTYPVAPIEGIETFSRMWFDVMVFINDHSYDGTFCDLAITTTAIWERKEP